LHVWSLMFILGFKLVPYVLTISSLFKTSLTYE